MAWVAQRELTIIGKTIIFYCTLNRRLTCVGFTSRSSMK